MHLRSVVLYKFLDGDTPPDFHVILFFFFLFFVFTISVEFIDVLKSCHGCWITFSGR